MVTAIYGQGNSGKSTSIRFMAQVLLRGDSGYALKFPTLEELDEKLKNGLDILAIFQNDKKKTILLSSGGDNEWIIEDNLNKLWKIAGDKLENWEDIWRKGKSLLITGVKYGKETGAAEDRAYIVNTYTGESATWIHPPLVWGKDDWQEYAKCPEYELVYTAFAYAVLAPYDENFKKKALA